MEQADIEYEILVREKSRKGLLYWSIASMVIFFGAFLSYYMVMMHNSNWLVFQLPDIFFLSSSVIVISSITLLISKNALKTNNFKLVSLGLFATLVLGIAFCILQFKAWEYLFAQKIVFAGRSSNVAGSILYVITFMHFVHIIAGLIALLVTFIKSTKHQYTSEKHLGFSLCSIFWHFLDILWVILFLFLYFNR
jgi:cytochrome c oxidase subunit 3